MTRPAAKERELRLLESFLRGQSISAGIIVQEGPDFLLSINDKCIGVEVTELYKQTTHLASSLQARESAADKIIASAESRFTDSGGPSLRVSVIFAPDFNSKVRRDIAADKLTKLVSRLLEQPGDELIWRPEFEDYQQSPLTFTYIRVRRQPPHFSPHWFAVDAGWAGTISLDHIQQAIDDKAKRISVYKQSANTVWLLLAIQGSRPSQFFDMNLPFTPSDVQTPFDMTYLFDAISGKTIKLGK